MLLHYLVKVKTSKMYHYSEISPKKIASYVSYSFIKVDQSHHMPYIYLLAVLYSKACVKQIHDINDLRKCLIQTCFD